MKFFPGKGCGTTTPINILDKIPLDTSNLECVIVNEEVQVEKEKEKKDVYATSETLEMDTLDAEVFLGSY